MPKRTGPTDPNIIELIHNLKKMTSETDIKLWKALAKRLENEASNLIAHGDYILHQVQAARELQRTISSHDLWVFVRDFFDREYEGSEFIRIYLDLIFFISEHLIDIFR